MEKVHHNETVMFNQRKMNPRQDAMMGKLLKSNEESEKMYEGVKLMNQLESRLRTRTKV